MNTTKCLKYEQPSILNEVIKARDKEKVIDKNLQHAITVTNSIPQQLYMYH